MEVEDQSKMADWGSVVRLEPGLYLLIFISNVSACSFILC